MFNNWEELSQKSRVELLNGNEDSVKRIVHNPGWEDKFIKIVEKYKANIIKNKTFLFYENI